MTRPIINVEEVGLPPRPFLYTRDQVAALFHVSVDRFNKSYCFYVGRTSGAAQKDKLRCVNIAPEGERPDWRVNEWELRRFLRGRGFKSRERGWHGEIPEDD